MANLKSFDEKGLHRKIAESAEVVKHYADAGGFERDTEQNEFLDAIDVSVSAVIELVLRGHATPEQELALYTYLKNNGVID
jgi:hypothetical protein